MKRITNYLKMRVLGALEYAAGHSMEARYQAVSQMVFHFARHGSRRGHGLPVSDLNLLTFSHPPVLQAQAGPRETTNHDENLGQRRLRPTPYRRFLRHYIFAYLKINPGCIYVLSSNVPKTFQ